MAVYGTYSQNGLNFSITNVSSSSDATDPTFTYVWSCTNRAWVLTPDFSRTGATLTNAHASENGEVTVTVTEVGTTNSRKFGGAVNTEGFPA